MNRQHPWPHAIGNRILISIIISELRDHCQNLLDDQRELLQTRRASFETCLLKGSALNKNLAED